MAGARRQELDRAAAVPGPANESLFFEVGEVLVHRGERRQAEPPANLLEARGVAVLLNEFLQVIEDFALASRQWLHGNRLPRGSRTRGELYAKKRRKSIGWGIRPLPYPRVVGFILAAILIGNLSQVVVFGMGVQESVIGGPTGHQGRVAEISARVRLMSGA